MLFRPIVACAFLFVSAHAAGLGFAQEAAESSQETPRVAWQYVELSAEKPTCVIRHRKGKEWFADRSDGKEIEYAELSRNDEEIIVQNLSSKLIIRLTEGRGYWRLAKEDEVKWRTWVRGNWIAPPASVPSTKPGGPPFIRLAYFVPADREPVASYRRKIGVVMGVVSQLYRDDLRRKRHSTDGLKFEHDEDGAIVHLIHGPQAAKHYNNAPEYDAVEQWRRVVPPVHEQLGEKNDQVIVIFSETYDDGPAEHTWAGVIARGSYYSANGGAAMFSAHLLKDEFCGVTLEEQRRKLFDRTPVLGRRVLGQPINTPRGKFAEAGIGAVAHEVGHALGLPHDHRRDDQFIMGNGFRNLRRNFSTAATRRVGFSLENASLRSAVFSDMIRGSIVGGEKLTGTSRTFRVRIPQPKVENGAAEVRVIVTDTGGNQTRVQQKLRVN